MIGSPSEIANKRLPAAILLAVISSANLYSQGAAIAQPPVNPKTTTRLTLGSASGMPGSSVVVPIYFTPAEQDAVGQTSLTISFVSKNLKFSKVDLGAAAELSNVEIKTETKDGKNDQGLETTALTVRAVVPGEAGKAIPSGLLGYLSFNILETAVPANISLRAEASAQLAGSSKAAGDVRAFGAQVEVLAEGEGGMVACFFFTH
ncbi:MAG: hypothetical protein EXQ56_01740 [Acidobacteria bacterium]|nr:hypothetical protein [Acidobacteriota bacterium]